MAVGVPLDETPEPVKLAVWGLLLALSVTVKVALLVPVAAGVKVTLIAQLDPAARLEPQLLVCPKSPLLVPVMAMPVIDSAALPEFERVTAWAVPVVPTVWLGNVKDVGDRLATGEPPVPVQSLA